MSFRIEVCANSGPFATYVIERVIEAATFAGVADILDVVAHDHVGSDVTTALVVASNQGHDQPADGCVTRAFRAEQLLIPVIDDIKSWDGRLPDALASMNAIAMADDGAGRKVLEAAGVLTPLRGVFLSHRRSDGGAMALQLAGALRRRGLSTFVDVLDIPPNEHVQQRVLAALDQMACLVLLESPEAITSPWVKREIVYAQERQLGVLSLCWADEPDPGKPKLPTRFEQFDTGNRVDVRPYVSGVSGAATLSAEGVELAVTGILREFSQALYFRRLNLEREVMAAAPNAGRKGPWHFEVRGSNRSRLIGLAPYRPDALDLYQLAVERDRWQVDEAVLVHAPISQDTSEALMLTWLGKKGPELASDTEQLGKLLI